ncbi:c-type cytochrome [Nitrosophilus alvini]|uniref:c-type cytochrome n=1 Tax=Nitrosophilus alvini TaxID=2714855 RepID=UPI00190D5835|nr:c-type cytochrome [Nitrosophilus alvini]
MKKIAILGLIAAGAISLMAADGAALYKKCAGCHGAKGEKKALGKSVAIGGWDKAKTVEALKGYKEGKRNIYGMGALMKGQVVSYSDEDIQAVAEYIEKLK